MNDNLDTNNKIVLDLHDKSDSVLLVSESSIKVKILMEKMKYAFSTEGFKELKSSISNIANLYYSGDIWFNNGVDCELLEAGKNWKKGKVKINIQLEFIPDEPEPEIKDNDSVLDDMRQSIN
ncbi:KGK domain-containing protein [Crocosphaera watsonii]|uniref:KGK domain protein n=1 Tax=Crocosphaera watsonii WH 8502 TaxID=423474 RepID=T2I8X5_CROWT|nr:KGK domain-containing protein [Crocosphaera watsonii]CCQ49518.1 conserved hypothetical protein [Crocosphaera watsonii WH 8502]